MSTLQDQVNERITQAKQENIDGKARIVVKNGRPSHCHDGKMWFGNLGIRLATEPMHEPGEGFLNHLQKISIYFHAQLVFEEEFGNILSFLPDIDGWREELEQHYADAVSSMARKKEDEERLALNKKDQADLALKRSFGL